MEIINLNVIENDGFTKLDVDQPESTEMEMEQVEIIHAVSPTVDLERMTNGVKIKVNDYRGSSSEIVYDGPKGEPGEVTQAEFDELSESVDDLVKDVSDLNSAITKLAPVVDDLKNSKADAIYNDASGSLVSFSDGADDMPVKALTVRIEPVQNGKGDPSPENIRPISGWTGVKIQNRRKNLFNLSEYVDSDWKMSVVQTYPDTFEGNKHRFYYKNGRLTTGLLGKLMPLGRVTISFYKYYENNDRVYFHYVDDAEWTNHSGNITNIGFYSFSSNPARICDGVSLYTMQGTNASGRIGQLQIEVGSVATDYESPLAVEYDITFPSEAGTVYGGTLDVTNGVLTVDRAEIASYAGETLPGEWMSDRDVYTEGATPTTGAQVVYTLAEPITYQLTPADVKTLLGQNNIWADTGDVSTTYPADTKLYIDGKIAELQALILENNG